MKNTRLWITIPLLLLAIYWSFHSLMPSPTDKGLEGSYGFSTDLALEHVVKISQKPHAVGFPAHQEVRDYIVRELEELGLEVSLQEGYTAGDWGNYSKATNIVSRIRGSGSGKALLLLSHYDSNPHSSLGASDAGSGVATILEGLRAFLEKNKNPKNDIIILISDAEELGLNGADLFANRHPWTSEVGLILNFEARGSGGPSYMFMETNRGNEKLIEAFIAADPDYPVSNSLAYSIYKLLPNDTDLTVFREDRDIEGFNFAFIDDHFDYHTVRDSYERLDRNSLTHQGSYLMPLLHHFSEADLGQMKSLNDHVYFNIPVFKMVSYPFDWIWAMWYIALAALIILLIAGFKNQRLTVKGALMGFLPLLVTLMINGIIGYFAWTVITAAYPGYKDILQGFPYNGHTYILAMVLLSLAVCFWVYQGFKSVSLPDLLVGPAIVWLAICWGVAQYLPGASFFVIPLYAFLASFLLLQYQKEPNPLLLLFLALPAIFILAPYTSMFPVALGMKMGITTTLITPLIFALLLPLAAQYKWKKTLGILAFSGFMIAILVAHLNSGFTPDRAKPTSLVYVLNTDDKQAQWATYEKDLSAWTRGVMGSDIREQGSTENNIPGSKYNSRYTFWALTDEKEIPGPVVTIEKDTTLGDTRFLEVGIFPQRNVNRLEVFTGDTPILNASINGIELSPYYLKDRRSNRLFTHYISNNDSTFLQVSIPRGKELNLTLYEASNDLLENPEFEIPPRPEENIPMPFVLNDAVITIKSIRH
ncbi:Peptidase family M28 [Muriicola jejuensis]|uniref:Vacuolar membrane protease n=1 Tax=Muriicola jejuensis TaxID=504488 RepID=A0A6P0U957_9FLAO|nr:M28 family peptidase [Muriicola jejuensis]NER09684.1 M28 family peptidase [Muriicola jejuensis]SMP06666.1 Peptidase family M28 [Muriicola jejuensis]